MNGCQNGNGTCETNGCCEANGNSKDHCTTGKVFNTAGQIYVHTGNLTNWSRSSSKMVKSTTDEVSLSTESRCRKCFETLTVVNDDLHVVKSIFRSLEILDNYIKSLCYFFLLMHCWNYSL